MLTARSFVTGLLVAFVAGAAVAFVWSRVDGAILAATLSVGLIELLPHPPKPEPGT